MKLTVVAATGGVGRHVLEQAVDAGHDVTAVVRDPARLTRPVRTVVADLAAPDAAVLEPAVAGADAVLSGLGPRNAAEHGIVSRGTRAIVDAMAATGVRRIVTVSVAGVGLTKDAGAGIFVRYVVTPLSNRFLGRHYADVALMEDLLRGSGLEWTAVGLPLLTDKPPTGRYRTAYGRSVRRGLRISRADAAGFLLHAVDQPVTFGQTVAVAY